MNSDPRISVLNSDTGDITIGYNREKLDTGIGYDSNCIVDEAEWFNNVSKTESDLKYFYDKTGVQPYIYIRSAHSGDEDILKDTEDYSSYTEDYFNNTLGNPTNGFLFIYFDDGDGDPDNDWYADWEGDRARNVVDETYAVEIFYNYFEKYWDEYPADQTDAMFTQLYKTFADTIMTEVKSSDNDVKVSNNDVKKTISKAILKILIVLAVIIAVIVVLIILIVFWTKKQQRKKEEAEETERILNTPMQDLVQDAMEKDRLQELKDKYDNQ